MIITLQFKQIATLSPPTLFDHLGVGAIPDNALIYVFSAAILKDGRSAILNLDRPKTILPSPKEDYGILLEARANAKSIITSGANLRKEPNTHFNDCGVEAVVIISSNPNSLRGHLAIENKEIQFYIISVGPYTETPSGFGDNVKCISIMNKPNVIEAVIKFVDNGQTIKGPYCIETGPTLASGLFSCETIRNRTLLTCASVECESVIDTKITTVGTLPLSWTEIEDTADMISQWKIPVTPGFDTWSLRYIRFLSVD